MLWIECFLAFFKKQAPRFKKTDRLDPEGARPDEHRSYGVACELQTHATAFGQCH